MMAYVENSPAGNFGPWHRLTAYSYSNSVACSYRMAEHWKTIVAAKPR